MEDKFKSPWKVKEIKFQRQYKVGYTYRREIVDDSDYGGNGDLEMVSCYDTKTGEWIGDSKTARMLYVKYGIRHVEKTDPKHNVVSIGYNPEENKWYGWSHRAIYGFGIGSTVKKGDCGYIPDTPQKLYAELTGEDEDGYSWIDPENAKIVENGVLVKFPMVKAVKEDPDTGETLKWEEDEPDYHLFKCGRGEWTANTIEDAKQMAIDFADGVS